MTTAGVLAGFFLLLAAYCAVDPFKHSAISEFPDFEALLVEMPAWSDLPVDRDHHNLLQKSEIKFLNQVQGPESMAFDPAGRGPYTGVADGRILFWDGQKWNDFAYTSANRSGLCDPQPSLLGYVKNEHICGRPLGLRFDKRSGDLYIADAYFGLMKVGPEGGLATSLTSEAEGVPLGFTNDLDIDDQGNIYFTDSSTKYQRRNFLQLVFSSEDSGRVLKYDPNTKETTVLVRNLQFPNGISLSKDGSFFVFCEGQIGRLTKYWLKGEKAGTWEPLVVLPGFPDNVRTNENNELTKYWLKGEKAGTWEPLVVLPGFPDNVRTNENNEFWVAIHCRRTLYPHILARYPKVRTLWLKLPISAKLHYLMQIGGRLHGAVLKYSADGKLLQILEDSQGKVVKAVSEVEEKDGKLWMGSVLMSFVAVYDLH